MSQELSYSTIFSILALMFSVGGILFGLEQVKKVFYFLTQVLF